MSHEAFVALAYGISLLLIVLELLALGHRRRAARARLEEGEQP